MTDRNYKKKLIEVALPLEQINEASSKEKARKIGKPSSIHLWWARRPFAACRAIIFAQLVDDPSAWKDKFKTTEEEDREREHLFKILGDLLIWENSTDENVINRARKEIAKYVAWGRNDKQPGSPQEVDEYLRTYAPVVYDPFCGGGGIPLEAQRLGIRSWGSDLNPVAVTISKAMVETPPKFASMPPVNPISQDKFNSGGVWNSREVQGLAEDINYYSSWIKNQAEERIGHLYPEIELSDEDGGGRGKVISWIWARTVASPNPACNNAHVPLVKSFKLSSKGRNTVWIEPIPDIDNLSVTYRIRRSGEPTLNSTVQRTSAICIFSGEAIPLEYIQREGKAGRIGYSLMAIVAKKKSGRAYLAPNDHHSEIARSATFDGGLLGGIEHLTSCTNCVIYGLEDFGHLFTNRQLTALTTLADLVQEARTEVYRDSIRSGLESDGIRLEGGGHGADAYADAITMYLALILDRVADWNSTMSRWESKVQVPQQTFGRQALPMVWDFSEANPLGDSTGSFVASTKNVIRSLEALKHLDTVNSSSRIFQADAICATTGEEKVVITTDPPYYDNIPYSNLSDYFYIWLRKSIKNVFPTMYSTLQVPKSTELVANKSRHGGVKEAESFFLENMSLAIENMQKIASDEYPIAIFYAFKQSEVTTEGTSSTGWATFLEAIISAGFTIVGTWPMRTENTTRMMAQGNNALSNSVVLVCRKRVSVAGIITRAEFVRALKKELPNAINALQKASITPVDMPQASIGPGIGIFSRHQAVLESDDSSMSVKTALQIINKELDEFLSEQEGEFDADTRFAVTWFEQNRYESGDFGDADNLARARGLSVDSVKHAGIIQSGANKVRLLSRDELEEEWSPASDSHLTVWECAQYLIRALENEGEYAAAVLLKMMSPDMADAARDLAYRLFDISDKQGEAKEAGAYNSLIAVWPDLTARAAQISDADLKQEQLQML